MRLSHGIYDRVMRLLPELYVCRTIPEFLDNAVRVLKPLVVCDGCGWFIFAFDNPEPKIVTIKESDPCVPNAMIPSLGSIAQSHPFVQRWADIGEPVALMLSDFPQRVALRHCDEHRDFYVCTGKNHMTIPVTVSESGASALSFRSYGRRFSEEERMVANLLRPHLQQAFANAETFSKAIDTALAVPISFLIDGLTERESQVAFWIAQGKTNREIAVILSTAPRTVEKHVENVLKKLQVENRTTAALQLFSAFRDGRSPGIGTPES